MIDCKVAANLFKCLTIATWSDVFLGILAVFSAMIFATALYQIIKFGGRR